MPGAWAAAWGPAAAAAAGGTAPPLPPAAAAAAAAAPARAVKASVRQVGQVCCLWNHWRRHAVWKICEQGSRFAPPPPCISSRHTIHTLSTSASCSTVASGLQSTREQEKQHTICQMLTAEKLIRCNTQANKQPSPSTRVGKQAIWVGYLQSKLAYLKRHSHRTFPQLSSAKKEALPARFSIDLLYKTDLAKSIFRFDRCSTPWCVPRTFLDPATTRILRDEY